LKWEPKAVNVDDKVLELKHESKYKPKSELYETVNKVKFGTHKLGPLRLWLNAAFTWNTLKEKKIDQGLNI